MPLARQRHRQKQTHRQRQDKDKSTITHAIFEYLSFETIKGEQKTNTKFTKIYKYTNLQIYTNIQIYVQ